MTCSHCGRKPLLGGEYFVVKGGVATCASCETGLSQLKERLQRGLPDLQPPVRSQKGASPMSSHWRPKGGS